MAPMIIFAIVSAGAAAYFAACFFLLKRSLRRAGEEMLQINSAAPGNQRLICAAPDRDLEALLAEINRELQQSQNALVDYERKERELRRQIANISHDLRTPLTSILGYLELLEDEAASDQERRQYLTVIRQRSKALQELIATFYDLSRLESGEYPLSTEPVSLSPLLCDVLALFYREFEKAGFQVETRISETLPAVDADKAAVRRVFFNLVQNILNHGYASAIIEQRELPPACGGEEPQEPRRILTRLSNQVCGLTEEDAARVFERFFTADQTRSGQNTGLGMTIVQRLVSRMGHQIDARLEQRGDTS